jgi:hypothetical protein
LYNWEKELLPEKENDILRETMKKIYDTILSRYLIYCIDLIKLDKVIFKTRR